jgi:crotonobetainyl-CoA:carnitine CoA-transferase CaiB-like acyl-CoA transferase
MTNKNNESAVSDAALSGVLVVELGSRVGAGVCGSLLAQLGASVILVESAEERSDGKWSQRQICAAGKLSLKVDPNLTTDGELLADLVRCSDVVVRSTDVDTAAPVPVGATNPVFCDITAYGRTGALAGKADADWQIQASTGIIATTGTSGGAPLPVPLPIVEYMTGVYAAASIVAALRVKSATGKGQQIDMALYDCAFASMATFLPRVLTGSKDPIPRIGNRHPLIAPWNVYEARDGWILICVGSDAQWQRVCDLMGRPEFKDAPFSTTGDRVANVAAVDAAMQTWVGSMTITECADVLNKAQIACGPIVRIEDGRPREPNLDHRVMVKQGRDPIARRDVFLSDSPLRMSASPGRAGTSIPFPDNDRESVRSFAADRSRSNRDGNQPFPSSALSGIRIVEIGHYTTVPLSSRILAGLGAEVVKIEPPGGEATRPWPPVQGGQGYFFTYMNSDKRSLELDLRKQADAEHLRNLLRESDILMENLKPGALAARGFSAQQIADLNPSLIYCSVSGFGAYSLYSGRPAYDSVIQAMSGLMDIIRANDVPMKTGISIADLLGAEMAVLAVLAALKYRDRTGRGQFIDLSMQDIACWLTEPAWNGASAAAPLTALSCSDGQLLAEGSEQVLAPLGVMSHLPDSSRDEVAVRLERSKIRFAPVSSVHELASSAQTKSRQLWYTVTKDGLTWPLLASPLRLEGTPPQVRSPMPPLGQDNHLISKRRAPSLAPSVEGR